MIDYKELSFTEKLALARKFLLRYTQMSVINNVETLCSFSISRDDFDMFIIDNGLAEDPGTSDPRSIEHKGYVQQRSNARRALNGWAAHLPNNMSFAVETHPKSQSLYRVVAYADNAVAMAKDVGHRIEKFAANKVNSVRRTKDALIDKGCHTDALDEFIKMSAMIEGYSIVMQRNIKAETDKFNNAMDMLDQKALEVNAEMETMAITA